MSQAMKAEIDATEAAIHRLLRTNKSTAPSLRVPVTAENRLLLRRLRAAEQSAWEAGNICNLTDCTRSPGLAMKQAA